MSLDRAALRRRALSLLARYGGNRARLRELLLRAARRAGGGPPPEELEALLDELEERGFLDDRAFALARARDRLLRGSSPARVRSRLLGRGLSRETVEAAFEELAADWGGDPEWLALAAYLRRNRMGPWGLPGGSGDEQRELARLVRAGFSPERARLARACRDEEELAELLREQGLPWPPPR